jgi:N-dimethylarginine dimethylaminohydrolase
MIYKTTADLDFRLDELAEISVPTRVLMTTPEFFDVQYVINPHMEGNVGTVDTEVAESQWDELRRLYESLGVSVDVVRGQPSMPDMVFCANQTLPYRLQDESQGVILSRMHAAQRTPEVEHFEQFFRSSGYAIRTLPASIADFEGMGDALWHAGRLFLWGGYGFRSSLDAYTYLSDTLDVKVAALHLDDPDFYHLDTCLSVLSESTALIFPGAFDADGLDLIHTLFQTVIEAPEDESRHLFACNAHSPDGQNVIIQAGCEVTVDLLRNHGLNPIEVRTDEFLKAGGSVFCMKQMFW